MMDDSRDPAHLLALAALIRQSVHTILEQDGRPHAPQDEPDVSPSLPANTSRRDAVMILEGACAQLCAAVAAPEHTIVNHAFAMITPACLRVALEARVAEHLRAGPKSTAELGALTGVDAGKLARVLRYLALRQCFLEVGNDVFANTKLSECPLPENATSALVGLYVVDLYDAFGRLADVLLDPNRTAATDKEKTAFARAHGGHIFQLTEKDPALAARVARAMHAQTQLTGGHTLLVDVYPWADLAQGSTFCDVGGGTGAAALALLAAHPHIKAVVQDQPKTLRQAHLLWNGRIESDRVQLVPMDFFAEPPVGGCAVYYLKQILHDWPDADCAVILRNVRAAMTTPHCRLLIHDIVLNYHPSTPSFPLLHNYGVGAQRTYNMDMTMMAALNSRERTLEELIALCEKACLKYVKIWDGGELKMVEFEAQ